MAVCWSPAVIWSPTTHAPGSTYLQLMDRPADFSFLVLFVFRFQRNYLTEPVERQHWQRYFFRLVTMLCFVFVSFYSDICYSFDWGSYMLKSIPFVRPNYIRQGTGSRSVPGSAAGAGRRRAAFRSARELRHHLLSEHGLSEATEVVVDLFPSMKGKILFRNASGIFSETDNLATNVNFNWFKSFQDRIIP